MRLRNPYGLYKAASKPGRISPFKEDKMKIDRASAEFCTNCKKPFCKHGTCPDLRAFQKEVRATQ